MADDWLPRLPKPQQQQPPPGRRRLRRAGETSSNKNPFSHFRHEEESVSNDSDSSPNNSVADGGRIAKRPGAQERQKDALQWVERISNQPISKSKVNVPPIGEGLRSREELKARRAALVGKPPSPIVKAKKEEEDEEDDGPSASTAATNGGGGSKKGRLRRKRDDSSDEEDILASPKPRRPAATGEDDDIILLDDIISQVASPTSAEKKAALRKRTKLEEEDGDATAGAAHASEIEDDKKLSVGGSADGENDNKEKKEEEEGDDDSEEEEDEDKLAADRIMKVCEIVSETLMNELQYWGKRKAEDRIDLISMEAATPTSSSSSQGSKRIDSAILQAAMPEATLKPYQLVGLNWLYLLHQLEFDIPRDLLPPDAFKGRYGEDPIRINGVLADDMGLGKTIQTIAFLAYLNTLQPDTLTHMIIVPASVLANWENEFDKFAPDLCVWTYHGSVKERRELRSDYEDRINHVDIILATYTLFEKDTCDDDRRFLNRIAIEYMVLDEGHSVKNTSTQRFIRLRRQKVRRRLVLSGTPLQNHVNEFLSLLSFLNPRIINPEDDPEGFFKILAAERGEQEAIRALKKLFAPFILRRLKSDVLDQLTAKKTELELLEMPETQRQVYESVTVQHMERIKAINERQALEELVLPVMTTDLDGPRKLRSEATMTADGNANASGLLSKKAISSLLPSSDKEAGNIFVEWRKAANHPLLLRRRYDNAKVEEIAKYLHQVGFYGWECTQDMVQKEVDGLCDFELHNMVRGETKLAHLALPSEALFDSCKCQRLKVLLPQLLEQGHRCLIFSTWTRILDILGGLIEVLNIPFLRLDGSTKIQERQQLIDDFNAPDSRFPVFLLSTRAGGLGINLTSADTVILHDPDFNPSFDSQCEDRAHRIGQTKDVTVYKLVAKDTVDEKIFKVATNKKAKTDALLDGIEGSERENDSNEISKIVQEELSKWLQAHREGIGEAMELGGDEE